MKPAIVIKKILPLVLAALVFCPSFLLAQTNEQKLAIDTYINSHPSVSRASGIEINMLSQIEATIFRVEKEVEKIQSFVDQMDSEREAFENEVEAEALSISGAMSNPSSPYQDKTWLTELRVQLKDSCCRMQSRPGTARKFLRNHKLDLVDGKVSKAKSNRPQ